MECRDAQFYLRLQRHTTDELGADVTGALDGHLALCPACAADARAAKSFDRAVASAMRAVPVPANLRERLITQAAAKQGAILRRKMYRAAAVCAAAIVLLGIGLGVLSSTRPKLDLMALLGRSEERVVNPEESTERWLAEQKLPERLPRPFDYDRLFIDYGFERVQDTEVPFVLFRAPEGGGFAKVYIFREDGRFDLKGLQDAQASHTRAEVMIGQERFRGFTYVFVYTGLDLKPFLRGGGPA